MAPKVAPSLTEWTDLRGWPLLQATAQGRGSPAPPFSPEAKACLQITPVVHLEVYHCLDLPPSPALGSATAPAPAQSQDTSQSCPVPQPQPQSQRPPRVGLGLVPCVRRSRDPTCPRPCHALASASALQGRPAPCMHRAPLRNRPSANGPSLAHLKLLQPRGFGVFAVHGWWHLRGCCSFVRALGWLLVGLVSGSEPGYPHA